MENVKIECPQCGWKPDGTPYWMCSKCHYIWNTFDTAAQCPACGFQHEYTSCIPHAGGCYAYEPHVDWYKNLDEIVQEELDEILIEQEAAVTNTVFLKNIAPRHSPCADAESSLRESAATLL